MTVAEEPPRVTHPHRTCRIMLLEIVTLLHSPHTVESKPQFPPYSTTVLSRMLPSFKEIHAQSANVFSGASEVNKIFWFGSPLAMLLALILMCVLSYSSVSIGSSRSAA